MGECAARERVDVGLITSPVMSPFPWCIVCVLLLLDARLLRVLFFCMEMPLSFCGRNSG